MSMRKSDSRWMQREVIPALRSLSDQNLETQRHLENLETLVITRLCEASWEMTSGFDIVPGDLIWTEKSPWWSEVKEVQSYISPDYLGLVFKGGSMLVSQDARHKVARLTRRSPDA